MAALEPAVAKRAAFDARDDHGLGFLDGVSCLLKQGDSIWRDAALNIKAVGFPLMMDTPGAPYAALACGGFDFSSLTRCNLSSVRP